MIFAYPDRPTVLAGQVLRLHYSGDRPTFAVDIYRQGVNEAPDWMMRFPAFGWLDGNNAPFQSNADENWPFIDIPIAADAAPGVYIANLSEADDNAGTNVSAPDASKPDGRDGKALFVVRNGDPRRSILLKSTLFTYHAYNQTRGPSLYDDGSIKAFLHRPGGGTGGDPFDFINDPDSSSPRQTFMHWEAPFIRWLEDNGYKDAVDYCTDLDVELNAAILSPYQLLVCVGHDEYWTPNIRGAIARFRDAGGNVAIFSGNTSYRPIEFLPNAFAIQRTGAPTNPQWIARQMNPPEPENPITGVSYARAGGWWFPERPKIGYAVKASAHWVFTGLGLARDQVFGADDFLVGYECDGCLYADDGSGNLFATGEDTSPTNFQVLGVGPTPGFSRDTPGVGSEQVATMGAYVAGSGAIVFNAATTDWGRVLTRGSPEGRRVVGGITHNVLTRLGRQRGLATLATFERVVAVDGFFSPDDNFRHAIVAAGDGSISELFFNPQQGQGQAQLIGPGALGNVIDVAGFYSDDDRFRHVLATRDDGSVWEIFFNPQQGKGQVQIGAFTNAVAVSGFFSPDDNYRHAIVAAADSKVAEIFYNPQSGSGQVVIGSFGAIADVGSFYSPDDGFRHAIVLTTDGNVTEIFYNPRSGSGQVVLANIPGANRVSAFYAANDALFGRRVIVAGGDGTVHEIKYGPARGIVTTRIIGIGGALDVGGFYSGDDGFRHAIVGSGDGSVKELFYRP